MWYLLVVVLSCGLYASYKSAGVDIEAGDALVERIAPLAKSTARHGADAQLGGFSSILDITKTDYKDPLILSTTDGVGTKLKLAIACKKHDTIGIDLVAMCVNDLLAHGAEPVVFLDYFATAKLDIERATLIIKGVAQGCTVAGCALSGGETAEMPGMYHGEDYDLAGFAIGLVERDQLLPQLPEIKVGDVILGLASSGIHSNGYSLVRSIIEKNYVDLTQKTPFESGHTTLGEALLEPTIIYVQALLPLVKERAVKALAHITGGGLLGNIPRVLPADCAAELDMTQWEVLPVFKWLAEIGNIPKDEMLTTFNLGIGMIAITDEADVQIIKEKLQSIGQKCFVIGKIAARTSEAQVIIHNNIFA